ncbi:MAG: helicase, partial [Deltaproteobacteria bacterium]|nr:helicase [Deltaproteobacteria bacterium]
GGLTLSRFIVSKKDRTRLIRPLFNLMVAKKLPRNLKPSKEELAADRIIGKFIHPAKLLPAEILANLLVELKDIKNIFINDQTFSVSSEPILPIIEVEKGEAEGVLLNLYPNPDVDGIIAPGVALCGKTVYPVGQRGICGDSMEKLPRSISYAHKDMAEFVCDVLPQLEEDNYVNLKVEIPETTNYLDPEIKMNMSQAGGAVTVEPEITYGDPPHVTISKNRMVYIRDAIPIRKIEKERKLEGRLRDDLNLRSGRKVTFTGKEAGMFVEKLQRWTDIYKHPGLVESASTRMLYPDLNILDEIFELSFVLKDRETGEILEGTAKAEDVLGAWQEGIGVATMSDGSFAQIPEKWLNQHGHLIQDILDARNDDKKVATATLPALAKLCDDLDLDIQPFTKKIRPLIDGFESIPETPLPDDIKATLRDYQKRGVDWLNFLKSISLGGILADDMGLGKTLQALCIVEGKTLVICPTSVIHNWASETEKFRPSLKVCQFHGPNRELDEDADIVITNYALLRIERSLLTSKKWDMVIMDEAQNIKNPSSQAARAAYSLKAEFKLALSGTPVENRLEDLWSIFNFANPGLLGTYRNFQKRLAFPINSGNQEASAILKKKITPFVLRRKKSEVELELPPRTDLRIECELTESEREIYSAVKATASSQVLDALKQGGSVMNALEHLLRLRQASCHPSLVPGHSAETSSKTEMLLKELRLTIETVIKHLSFLNGQDFWISFNSILKNQILDFFVLTAVPQTARK